MQDLGLMLLEKKCTSLYMKQVHVHQSRNYSCMHKSHDDQMCLIKLCMFRKTSLLFWLSSSGPPSKHSHEKSQCE